MATVDMALVQKYRQAGYPVAQPVPIEAHRVSALGTEAPWTVTVTRPKDKTLRPLIVYLPPLGDGDDAPNHWISTWAHAGYAVLAVQALTDDAQVWATPEARSGDFVRIARARYAQELMPDRLARLSDLLGRVRARSEHGDAGLEGLDWAHVALAGADLGAFSVQTVATAPAAQLAALAWPIAPLAFIAISPYATRTASAPPAPGQCNAPVLMISAREDIDSYGVITESALRHLAFDRLGKGDNFYLELAHASHRWLAGVVEAPVTGDATPAHRAAPVAGEAEHGPRRGGNAQRDAMAPGEGDDDDPLQEKSSRALAAQAAARLALAKSLSLAMTQAALSEVSFETVSIAFLDAQLRAQPSARFWLDETAVRWLQSGDRLKHG